MLQQTQVATVVPYFHDWLHRFPTATALAGAAENDVLRLWQGLGYYNRARNLHAAAKIVQQRHRGIFPRQSKAIRALPGVGRYTANAVQTFAFDRALPLIEANTARLLARLFNIVAPIDSGTGREQLWQAAASLVPARNAGRYNSALIDLGALVCLPRKPRCHICPIRSFCSAPDPSLLPIRKTPPTIRKLTEAHGFMVKENKVLLEQSSTRWRGMWTLPRIAARSRTRKPVYTAIFPFTNHRINLRVYRLPPSRSTHRARWIPVHSLNSIPLPSPHRRALARLLHPALARSE